MLTGGCYTKFYIYLEELKKRIIKKITLMHSMKSWKVIRIKNRKLQPGVNFINILHAHLLYKSKLNSFSLDSFGFVNC